MCLAKMGGGRGTERGEIDEKGTDYVHNKYKYNTTFLGVLASI